MKETSGDVSTDAAGTDVAGADSPKQENGAVEDRGDKSSREEERTEERKQSDETETSRVDEIAVRMLPFSSKRIGKVEEEEEQERGGEIEEELHAGGGRAALAASTGKGENNVAKSKLVSALIIIVGLAICATLIATAMRCATDTERTVVVEIDDEALSPSRLNQSKLDQSQQDQLGLKLDQSQQDQLGLKQTRLRSSMNEEDEESDDSPSWDGDGGVPERCRRTENRRTDCRGTECRSAECRRTENQHLEYQSTIENILLPSQSLSLEDSESEEYESGGNYVVVDSDEDVKGTLTENRLDRKRSIFEIFAGQDNATAIDVENKLSASLPSEEEVSLELAHSAELIGHYVNDLNAFFSIIDDLTRVLDQEAEEELGREANGDKDAEGRGEMVIEREENVIEREKNVIEREENVTEREENILEREVNVIERDENVVEREENVVEREENAEEREENAEEREKTFEEENAEERGENAEERGENAEESFEDAEQSF